MKLEKTHFRLPLSDPLFGIVKSILSPPDKELFVAAWSGNMSDAEIAETFGADARARVRELERGIGKLVSIQLDCAAWRAAMEAYTAERDKLQALAREAFGGRGRRSNERKEAKR